MDGLWLSKMWKMKNSTEMYQMFVEMEECGVSDLKIEQKSTRVTKVLDRQMYQEVI